MKPTQTSPAADKDASTTSYRRMAQVLDCFSLARSELSVGELATLTGMPRTTIHRIVSSLREIGLLDQNGPRSNYRLGLKLFQYGSVVINNLDIHTHASPYLQTLSQLSGETVHFHMFDGSQMVCIEREEIGENRLNTLTTIEAAPIYCTSVGKAFLAFQKESLIRRICEEQGLPPRTANTITSVDALLAELENIRAAGYAIDNEEHKLGVRCVGAPIRDASGQVFASVSASGPVERMPAQRLKGLAPTVIQTANNISKALGWSAA